ncbi:uncharacterized protein SPPG_09575 [Spizellomyces punctatus DAOM BR117]|uniref:Uncharacterized protein n=1 Tax=Spizellomyces punctatus (strain DAOM BR117) TaxID=645134 RepID=A0A0L0H4H8_SPIPD|nr:uncharacterized protein SPPG_09575 [Spizellomyces punctatus DAOM BR117]KNC95826.1 hypothetical protein SPPG_09575 [Spizellomyces punctatus DAOM BR117]|eukprot:XP_016603866.1 hypothetical protein SPPG_09575 [Spizellomyces punctatus DAOM BR117]
MNVEVLGSSQRGEGVHALGGAPPSEPTTTTQSAPIALTLDSPVERQIPIQDSAPNQPETAPTAAIEDEPPAVAVPIVPLSATPPPYGQTEEQNRKLFVTYRSRLRRTYMFPVLTWVPSFGLILYYAIVANSQNLYTWLAVGLWVVLLFCTYIAYRSKFHRLKEVSQLGLLASLPEEELNDIVMNGANVRPPPQYDDMLMRYDEPLPAYPNSSTRAGSVRSLRSVRSTRSMLTIRSMTRWWAAPRTGRQIVEMDEIRVDDIVSERERQGNLPGSVQEDNSPAAAGSSISPQSHDVINDSVNPTVCSVQPNEHGSSSQMNDRTVCIVPSNSPSPAVPSSIGRIGPPPSPGTAFERTRPDRAACAALV